MKKLLFVLILLTGCTNTVGEGRTLSTKADAGTSVDAGPQGGPVIIESIAISGSTLENAEVQLGDVADEDNTADQQYRAQFELKDCQNANCLGADPGTSTEHKIEIVSTRSSDSQKSYKTVTIKLH